MKLRSFLLIGFSYQSKDLKLLFQHQLLIVLAHLGLADLLQRDKLSAPLYITRFEDLSERALAEDHLLVPLVDLNAVATLVVLVAHG